MTGPAFGVRIGIDATGAKTGRDVYVRSIEEIKAASQAVPTVVGGVKSSVDALADALRKMGMAEDLVQRSVTRNTAALAAQNPVITALAAASTAQAQATGTALVLYQKQWTMSAEVTKQLQKEAEARRALSAATSQAAATASLATARGGAFFPQSTATAGAYQGVALQGQRLSELEAVRRAIDLKRAADERSVASSFAAAQALQKQGGAAVGAAAGTGKLVTGLQTLAFAATGLPGPVGRVAGALGTMAIGGPVTVGVLAGIAAIVLAWDTLTRKGREAKRVTDELTASLLEEAKARSGQTGRESRASLEARLREQTEQIEQFIGKQPGGFARLEGLNPLLDIGLAKRKETILALGELYVQDAEKYVEGVERQNDKDRARAAEQKRLSDQAARAADERLKAVGVLGDAERQRALEQATTRRDELTALAAIRDAAIATQVAASGLKGEEAERLRLLLQQSAAYKEQRELVKGQAAEEARLNDIFAEFLEERAKRAKAHNEAQIDEEKRLNDIYTEFLEERARRQERIDQQAAETAGAVRELFDDAFKDFFARGLKDWEAFFFSVQQLAGQAAQIIAKDIAFKTKEGLAVSELERNAGRALGGLSAGIGIGAASGSGVAGVFGGAAAGFVTGGPLGAAAGIVGGFLSALGGGAERARAAAEAQKAYNLNLADFVAIAHPRGALADALASLQKQFENLAQQAAASLGVKAGGAAPSTEELQKILAGLPVNPLTDKIRAYFEELLRLRKAFDDNIEATKRRIALERQQYLEDLNIRALRAQGRTQEAEAEALANQHRRERMALEKEYGETLKGVEVLAKRAAIAAQEHAQALEKERLATEQAFQSSQTRAGIQARIEELIGNTTEAARIRRTIAIEAEINEAGKLLDQGVITAEMYAQLADAIRNQAEAVNDATSALRQNLALRQLQAAAIISGNLADQQRYEDEARRVSQRLELEQAIKDGADGVTEALIKQTQAMEDQAVAADRARRALEVTTNLLNDLRVRELNARGLGGAADELATFLRQQDEVRRAVAGGESSSTIAEITRVQGLERARADELRRIAQQEAYDRALASAANPAFESDSDTRVNLAVGISEATGGRMAGLLTAQVAYQASLPRMEALMQENNRLSAANNALLAIIARLGPDVGGIDEALGILSSEADLANGVPAGNR